MFKVIEVVHGIEEEWVECLCELDTEEDANIVRDQWQLLGHCVC